MNEFPESAENHLKKRLVFNGLWKRDAVVYSDIGFMVCSECAFFFSCGVVRRSRAAQGQIPDFVGLIP